MGLVYWNRVGRKMGVELGLINRFGFLCILSFLFFFCFFLYLFLLLPYWKKKKQKEHERTCK